MIILLKITLCSSVLLAFYRLFLEKEKMYRFNRFYLLFALIFSYTVPFVSIAADAPAQMSRITTAAETTLKVLELHPQQEHISRPGLAWVFYAIVTWVLFAKTVYAFLKIKKLTGRKITYQNRSIILTEQPLSPFSFWNTIYLGKNYFTEETIDPRIFLHENCHLEQRHSLDLLLVELFSIFTWFNPSVFLYRKAIVTNHEFLADEAVLQHNFNKKDYQHLILQEIISAQNYNLTHTFHFKNTKKRFMMMNTRKSEMADIKKLICFPVLLIAFSLFVQKTYAHPVEKIIEETKKRIAEPLKKTFPEDIAEALSYKENKAPDQSPEAPERMGKQEQHIIQDTVRPKEGKNTEASTSPVQHTDPAAKDDPAVLPQFPGGINELRQKIARSFDSEKMKSEKAKGLLKAEISYTVNEKGNVEDLKVSGSNELFNREVYASFMKANDDAVWQPAEKEGKPINHTMRIPLIMSFE